jgi:transcriptional regulator with XRE-family HTH domain
MIEDGVVDRQANSGRIKETRKQLHWSQEEMSTASGLSLRTIQRLENGGRVSLETLKAIAATLELSMDEVTIQTGEFKGYAHVQRADYILLGVALIAVFIISIPTEVAVALSTNAMLIKALLIVPLVILGTVFYSLTIEINEEQIHWYFGPGLLSRTLPLQEIESNQAVKNPLWWGFGIRDFGYGRMYNVSGLLGVELNLKSGAKIRLGTDEPAYLNTAIDAARARG